MSEKTIKINPGVTLPEVVSSIKKGEWKIPRFQREFVWEKSKVIELLDSMYKEFPIGSFFLWIPPEDYAHYYKDIPELNIEKGSGTQGKLYVGNMSIETIISIAKTKLPNLLANNLKAAVKSVVGTCTSLGILVENKYASEIGKEIDEGKYDKEIDGEITETSEEKRKEMDEYFTKIKDDQEKVIKKEAAEKQAEEDKKAKKEDEPEGEKKEEKEEKK